MAYIFALSHLFLATLSAFLFGVYIAPELPFELSVYLCLFTALVLFLLIFYQDLFLRISSLVLIGVLLGVSYFHIARIAFEENNVQDLAGQEVELRGVVVDEPAYTLKYQKIPLGHIRTGRSFYRGKVLVFAERYPGYKIGDSLEVKGKLQDPPVFKDFNYKRYLEKERIFALLLKPEKLSEIDPIKLGSLNERILKSKATLLQVKSKFIGKLNQLLVEPYGAFLAGLLVGAREEIPRDLLEKFNQTGVIHIIAISGYNISIIIAALLFLGKRLARRVLYPLLGLVVLGFVVIVGGQASVVRAAIMAGLLILALGFGRKADAVISLVVAGVAMVLVNPYVLRFDAGFQLSFLATLGLIIFSDRFAKLRLIKKIPQIFREALIATLSAMILILPVLAFNFGRIPLVSPIVNMLVLPAVAPAMALGFITGILGFLWFGLAKIVGWIAFIFLYYMVGIVEGFSRLPFVSLEIEKFSWLLIVLYYLGVVWLWNFWRTPKNKIDPTVTTLSDRTK